MPGSFLDPLRLEYIDGRSWLVTGDFRYRLGSPEGEEQVYVPEGFVTDFASIPRIFWRLLLPTGRYGKAAVLHDWLYATTLIWQPDGSPRSCGRAEADKIFLEAMAVLGVGRVTRYTLYAGVRVGGWVAWNKHRRRENA